MKKMIFRLAVFSFCSVAFSAEMRIWEDKAGHKYEAEFVTELFDKVTLCERDGKERRLAVEELSDHDQKYLRVMVAPQIEINCKVSTEYKPPPWDLWHDDNASLTSVRGEVTVQKISKRPFTSRLAAELYLIAKEVDGKNFVLLSKTASSFLLLENNQYRHVLKSDTFVTRVYTEYNSIQRRGEEYAGYLVVISDAHGDIVGTRTDMGEWIATPEMITSLRELSIRGAPSVYSRHFDKTGKKTEVTRPKFYAPGNP